MRFLATTVQKKKNKNSFISTISYSVRWDLFAYAQSSVASMP